MVESLGSMLATVASSVGATSLGGGYSTSNSPVITVCPVWLSIDPRHGYLSRYPPAAEQALEKAYSESSRDPVQLGGLGLESFFEGLFVHLLGNDGVGIQVSGHGGQRDVRRFAVAAPTQVLRVHVVPDAKQREWRIIDAPRPGVTKERIVFIAEFFKHPTSEDLQKRAQNLQEEHTEGLVGLWEWCLSSEVDSMQNISPKEWAAYAAKHNGVIEEAFQAGELKASIAVDPINYDIMFEGASFGGRQLHRTHQTPRFVRRRAVPPAERSAAQFISTRTGSWTLRSKGGESLAGDYKFDSGDLTDPSSGESIGTFLCDPIAADSLPYPTDLEARQSMPCIGITASEIMAEIQKPSSNGAYFVLPSQLNGAEYPSHHTIVTKIQDYMTDNTGGPRGQLAVHPAAGQFVIDNAASDNNEAGINAIDAILREAKDFKLVNGYLRMPMPKNEEESNTYLESFKASLHSLRPLVMANVRARGLTPDKASFSKTEHQVNLVYASAVPVNAYLNQAQTTEQKGLHIGVAEAVLMAQYYGALKVAAAKTSPGATTKVFLMPLGGGVFNNPWESIAKSISAAVEMLTQSEHQKLNIQVLTWNGNPQEKDTMEKLLTQHNKLAAAEPLAN